MPDQLYKVKCWPRHQHFSGRRPPWIKLYRELLDDPDWHMLSGDSVKLLVSLWMLASEDETKLGHLPERKKMIFRLRTSAAVFDDLMRTIEHWIIPADSDLCSSCTHNDCILHTRRAQPVRKLRTSETEAEKETDVEAEKDADTEAETDTPLPPEGGSAESTAEAQATPKSERKQASKKAQTTDSELAACITELPGLWNAVADTAGFVHVRGDRLSPDNIKRLTALWKASDMFRECWRDLPTAFAQHRWYQKIHADITKALRLKDKADDGIPFEKVFSEWDSNNRPSAETDARYF